MQNTFKQSNILDEQDNYYLSLFGIITRSFLHIFGNSHKIVY